MHVVLFYDTCRLYILHILFDPFMRLKRVGSVLSRSEIDPFFIYGIIQFGPKTGLAPVIKGVRMKHVKIIWK